ncbi:hypothetical protein DPMN_026968 [Dreissena polymorpha]|uniref:Uncharacterized protein n=1 Tax=Dreissena polymorpha TaxID=45954 RepID=A0A9D4LS84_DREPO|nr:hypothetical protein DPMN_026968 [Dreissena polymorpha]
MPRPLGGHFHDDRTINVASRVLTRKNAPRPNIIRTNLLTKFHEDRKINVAYRVLTRKNAPPPGSHFHEDRTINVASRVLTRKNAPPLGSHVFQAIIEPKTWPVEKTAPPPGGRVLSPIWTIFERVQDFNKTNVLTKFHDDWTKIVTSRVFTRNTAPPPGGHTNILTLLHVDWASNVTSTVFTSFELSRGINRTNVLTEFHEDQTINVASRVFTGQNVDDARWTTHDGQKAITKAHHEHVVLR